MEDTELLVGKRESQPQLPSALMRYLAKGL